MKPKVPPETDEAVHEHVSGSSGGPGENSADCACGLSFAGFDTCAEVMAALNEHIAAATAEPRESKPASKLAPGDWLASVETDGKGPAKVIATHPYGDGGESMLVIVYGRPDGGEPAIVSAHLAEPIKLATAAEINAETDERRRAEFIAELRKFANWFEARPWLPVPYSRTFQSDFVHKDDAGMQAEARDLAERLRVTPNIADDRVTVRAYVGGIQYTAYSIRPKPVERTNGGDPTGTGYSEVVREPEQVEVPADITTTAYPVRGAAANGGGPFTRYFSFGHGQTDPKTGENLRDKYCTVIAPTAEGCRDAMLASRFGREWSMEYIPGTPRTDEWIARWTEHDRIVVDADGGCE